MYCTLSHMLGHVTKFANDHLYAIKINKDLLMRLLKAVVCNRHTSTWYPNPTFDLSCSILIHLLLSYYE